YHGSEKEGQAMRPDPLVDRSARLGAEGADDVREHVGDLVAHRNKDDDDDDRDQDQDQGVFDHSLTTLPTRLTFIQLSHLLSDRTENMRRRRRLRPSLL